MNDYTFLNALADRRKPLHHSTAPRFLHNPGEVSRSIEQSYARHCARERHLHTTARLFSVAGLCLLLALLGCAMGALADQVHAPGGAVVMGLIILWGLLGLRYLLARH